MASRVTIEKGAWWWNLDTTVADLIARGCDEMRTNGTSYPADMGREAWEEILTRISEPLHNYANGKSIDAQPAQEALRLFAEHLPRMWD
jgi:hypothetical protein